MEDLPRGRALQRDQAYIAKFIAPEAKQIRLIMDKVTVAVFHDTALACSPMLEYLRGRIVAATQ